MTRWDVYKAEVESSRLKWGIVHDEKFFRENARRMEGINGNFKIVKVRDDMECGVSLGLSFAAVLIDCLY
jgi:V-type H+-transporting ATPase subunit H